MEWLLKIIDFFKTEKKEGINVIHLNDLKEWLSLRTQEVMDNSSLDDDLTSYVNQLKDKRWLLECQLDSWDKRVNSRMGVISFKINKKEINILFKATRRLLDFLTFTEKINLENVLELTAVVEPKLEKLIRIVEESDFASNFNFLLTDEKKEKVAPDSAASNKETIINPLLKELLELGGLMKNFEQKVVKSGYRNIITLAEKQSSLENYLSEIKQIEEDLKNKQEKLTLAEENKREKEVQLQQVKEDPDYISREMILKEKENIQRKIEDNKDAIFTFFSKLKPLFIEYKEFGFKRHLIDLYLEDSVEAFLKDEDLSIRKVLEHVKIFLNSGKFSISFKDANSVLNVLEKGEFFLEDRQKKHFKLIQELEKFEKSSENNDFNLKIEDATYRLTHFSEQVERLKEKIGLLEEKAIETKELRDREIESFQNLVRIGMGKNISINF